MKKYMKPEIEITAFSTEDIITVSTYGIDALGSDEGIGSGFEVDLDAGTWEA